MDIHSFIVFQKQIISFERETEMVDNKKDKPVKAKSEIVKPDNEIKNFDIKRIAQQSQIHQSLHRKRPVYACYGAKG